MGRTRWSAAVLLVLGLTALAGCATKPAPVPPPAQVHPEWPGCDALGAFESFFPSNDTPGMGRVPDDFRPVSAVWCEVGARPGADIQADPVRLDLERRATDVGPLLDYLQRRGEVETGLRNVACPAMAWSPPWLFLLDADDQWVYPQIPTDVCGFPLRGEGTAEEAPWATLDYRDTVIRVRTDG